MTDRIDRNVFWSRLRALKDGASEATISMLDRASRVVCDGGLPNPSIWADGDHVEMEWNPGEGWSVTLEIRAIDIIGDATNTRTLETDDFEVPVNYPHDNLIADVWRLLVRAGWSGLGWPRIMTKTGMQEWLVGDFLSPLSGCHGEFQQTGDTLAALALYEAMSHVSEESDCAAWLDSCPVLLWSWLRNADAIRSWPSPEMDMTEERERIRALANISGVWWADYHYAVPLPDWIARHGPVPGIGSQE